MSGDQIAGVIGLLLMLLLVVPRLMGRQMATGTLIRMAVIWAVIIAVAVVAVWLIQSFMDHDLT